MIFVKFLNWSGTAEWSDCIVINDWHPLAVYHCGMNISATTKSERQWIVNNLCKAAQLVWYSRMVRLYICRLLASSSDISLWYQYWRHH
jgi:hypothetical protein